MKTAQSHLPSVEGVIGLRSRLLGAAERVVARDGVANMTLDAVAREAGVSKGGLLYHFPSKSALVLGVVESHATECEANHTACLKEAGDGPGAFTKAYVAARVEPLDPDEVRVHTALIAAAGTDPQYAEPFRKRMVEWQARLEQDGIDPVVATIVRLATDGLCFGTLLGLPGPREELRQRVAARLMEMIEGARLCDEFEKDKKPPPACAAPPDRAGLS